MDTITLLWRHEQPAPARRGRPPRLTTDDVVVAGIVVADRIGPGFSLREVAEELGVPVMSLYSYVDSREQLVELMVDHCHSAMPDSPPAGSWRDRLVEVAEANLALLTEHPWLAHRESERAILGPGTLAKYERELAAVEPLPLDDVTKDAALTVVLDFVRASARAQAQARADRAAEDPATWWEREGAKLAALDLAGRFPLADRIGSAAGSANRAATDAETAYHFGLNLILDGVEAAATRSSQ